VTTADVVSTDELGALLGVTARTVTELGRRGIIRRAGRGRWPLAESIRLYCEHLRETAAGRAGADADGRPLDLAAERAKLARAQRERVELDNAVRRGELVEVEGIRGRYAGMVTAAKSKLLGVPSKAKGRLPHLVIEDIETLEELIHEALAELAGDGRGGDKDAER